LVARHALEKGWIAVLTRGGWLTQGIGANKDRETTLVFAPVRQFRVGHAVSLFRRQIDHAVAAVSGAVASKRRTQRPALRRDAQNQARGVGHKLWN
jgi:hypothetical protein